MDEDIYPDELYHYGRKGMKWGQHIFGKERPAGGSRKKSSKDVENRFVSGAKGVAKKVGTAASNAYAKRKEEKRVQNLKKKKISDMTDDELAEYTDRMNRERVASLAKQQTNQLNPQRVSKGQAFIVSLGRDVLAPTAKNVGRQYLEKVLKDQLGLNSSGNSDPLKKLREEADRLGLEDRIADLNEKAKKRGTKDPLDDLRREAEEANLKNRKDRDEQAVRDRQKKRDEEAADEAANNYEVPNNYEPPRSSSRPSNTVVDVSPETVSSGYSYIESNRQLLNTPIAGLLPPGDDDRYR